MKETTNVSIAGIAFRLDNEGYLQLKNYLTRIELGYKTIPTERKSSPISRPASAN